MKEKAENEARKRNENIDNLHSFFFCASFPSSFPCVALHSFIFSFCYHYLFLFHCVIHCLWTTPVFMIQLHIVSNEHNINSSSFLFFLFFLLYFRVLVIFVVSFKRDIERARDMFMLKSDACGPPKLQQNISINIFSYSVYFACKRINELYSIQYTDTQMDVNNMVKKYVILGIWKSA